MSLVAMRELTTDDVNAVSGGATSVIRFGHGIAWILHANNGQFQKLLLCTPSTGCYDPSADA